MPVTVTLGWWLLPLIVTLALFVWAWAATPPARHDDWGVDIAPLFTFGFALVLSLVAWLLYAAAV